MGGGATVQLVLRSCTLRTAVYDDDNDRTDRKVRQKKGHV